MRVNVGFFVSKVLDLVFVGETVDGHDEVVVEVCRARCCDDRRDEVWEDAKVVCSAPQADEVVDGRSGRWERWLLFDDAVLALGFALAGAG